MANINPEQKETFLNKAKELGGYFEYRLSNICHMLRHDFPHYNWVGIYIVEGEMLRLGAWDGKEPTGHVLIPISRGLCGMAVRENRTVIVADVNSAPEYLACFSYTKSEIVVPIRSGTTVVGEIDIDGEKEAAYDQSDIEFLEALGNIMSGSVVAAQAAQKKKAA